MSNRQIIEISSGTIFKVAFVILALIFFWLIMDILIVLFLAIIIASAVNPASNQLQRVKIPRVIGVLLIYLFVIGFFVLIISFAAPLLVDEIKNLSDKLPIFSEKIEIILKQISGLVGDSFQITEGLKGLLATFQEFLLNFTKNIFSAMASLFGGVASFVMIVVISFYLSIQKSGIQNFLRAITPAEHETYVIDFWGRVEYRLGRWFQGQLFLGLTIGFLVFIGLTVLGIQYSLLLGILAGLLEFIPFAGPILAAIPAVLLGFLINPTIGIAVLALYLVIQQVENHLLVPMVMKKAVGLNPIIIILAMLVGAKLGSVVGLIIAVPLMAMIAEFFDDIAEAKKRTFKEIH